MVAKLRMARVYESGPEIDHRYAIDLAEIHQIRVAQPHPSATDLQIPEAIAYRGAIG